MNIRWNEPILILILAGIAALVLLGCVLTRKFYKFMSIRRVDRMDGVEFERYLLFLFKKQGYRGHMTKASGDFGADLILYDGDEKIAVQAKRYDKPVGVAAVQQAMAGQQYYDCDAAMVVTNMTFTRQARQLAAKSGVELLERDDLLRMMKPSGVKAEEAEPSGSGQREIVFQAKVGHEDPDMLSESVIYTILEEALEDQGYFVDGD